MARSMAETVEITALSNGPAAIARLASGKTAFVAGGVPGDVAEIEGVRDHERFCEAKIVRLEQASPHRVKKPGNPLVESGAAPWIQVDYPTQLAAKRSNVVAQLQRIGRFEPEIAEQLVGDALASPDELFYRNKIELNVGTDSSGRLKLGVHAAGSHDLVAVDTYPLAHKGIERAPKALQGALRYLAGTHDLGIFRIGVRHSNATGDVEIALWTKPGAFPRKAVATTLQSAVDATSVVRVMADPGRARRIKGVEALSGKGFWEEDVCGFRYKVSAPSFFQVNTIQAQRMVELAMDALEIDPASRVADLYCGVGTFTLPLARRAGEVFAVESAASSVRDLRRNAETNGIDGITVIGGDSARELKALGHLDALIVDPPRAGLAKGVAEDIAQAAPERMVYVSCDPATLARDLARLANVGYAVQSVKPVDLFPQTPHIECVCSLVRE